MQKVGVMYDTECLNDLISDYVDHCGRPTRKGLANALHISPSTINRVILGMYNGKLYGLVPHCNRCIDNKDFGLVRSVFANPCI